MKQHGCGLLLTAGEAEAFDTVPPSRVIFKPSRTLPGWGDIYLDTHCVGWYERADAERAAEFFGTAVVEAEPMEAPKERRY